MTIKTSIRSLCLIKYLQLFSAILVDNKLLSDYCSLQFKNKKIHNKILTIIFSAPLPFVYSKDYNLYDQNCNRLLPKTGEKFLLFYQNSKKLD